MASRSPEIIEIPYGEGFRSIQRDGINLAGLLVPTPTPAASDPEAAIRHALENPQGGPRLEDMEAGEGGYLILADDMTRSTPVATMIAAILEEFNAAGVPDSQVSVLIATGTHRPMTDAEVSERFGAELSRRVQIVNHDYRTSRLVDMGETEHGTPISVNEEALRAGAVIGLGSIVPHHIPGFSGGAKIIQPGISGDTTTAATHLFSALSEVPILGMVDSPVRREMEEVAGRVGLSASLNVTLNAQGELVEAFFGGPGAVFRAGAAASTRIYGVPARRGVDIVVAGSHPCDIEFWQAHKSLFPAAQMVRPGGTIVVLTPCPEGVARTHDDVLNYAAKPYDRIEQMITSGAVEDPVGASNAVAWARIRETADISIVSDGITPNDCRALGFRHFASLDDALADARLRLGRDASVSVMTHAPETLPLFQG